MYLWMLLLCSILLFPVTHYTIVIGNKIQNKSYQNGKKVYIVIFSILLIVITGLRADTVGKDTMMYHQLYDITRSASSFSSAVQAWQNKSIEVGFLFLEFLLGRIVDFHLASLIFAAISIVPVMILIYRYSENYWLSLFVYLAFGMYVFTFAGVRQSLAMGICCIAFLFAIENKFIKYIIAIVLAVFIHKSAVIFFPVYWLIRIKHNEKSIRWFFIGTVVSFGLRSTLYKVLNLFSRNVYESTGNAGGIKLYLFILGTLVLSYFVSKYFSSGNSATADMRLEQNGNPSIFNMVVFCALLWPITSANAVVFRLYYYYFLFLVLFIPNFISSISYKGSRMITLGVYLFVGCYFLQFYTLGNTQMMYSTYSFFWN